MEVGGVEMCVILKLYAFGRTSARSSSKLREGGEESIIAFVVVVAN